MRLESPAFLDGGEIPPEHSRDGGDVAPPLQWSGVPAGTASLALLCDDPDAPRYALDTQLGLPPGATKAQLEAAMKGHPLAESNLTGTYRRD